VVAGGPADSSAPGVQVRVEAQRSFADINNRPGSRRAGAMALQVLLRTTCGEPLDQRA